MLLVFTHKITPRVKFVFKQICTHILGVEVDFTTTIEDFIAHNHLKISYTKQPLSNELFIRSHDLLFQQGLTDLDINVESWEHTKCFFNTSERSALPFDIFAAAFYLLSRYEEYQPHVKDNFNRFPAQESLAYKHAFLHQPVIDIWAQYFKKILNEKYPEFNFPKKQFTVKPVIDVPQAYYFKNKGFMRTIGGTVKDLFQFKFKKLYNRYLVLFGFKHDPYNTFKYIINKQKQYKFKFLFFFLIGNYSTYDKPINTNKKQFIALIKHVADYAQVGLKASYFALNNLTVLKQEKNKLEAILNQDLKASRQSFSKLNIPTTYRHLLDVEITQDYTMGYPNYIGFRAGTCTPFFFYDLDYETQTSLKINPYCVLDNSLLGNKSLLDKQQTLKQLIQQVKKVNGTFIPIFHNYSFSPLQKWNGFKTLFNNILESNNET